jgi:hypothetical protein
MDWIIPPFPTNHQSDKAWDFMLLMMVPLIFLEVWWQKILKKTFKKKPSELPSGHNMSDKTLD